MILMSLSISFGIMKTEVIRSKDVVFNENVMYGNKAKEQQGNEFVEFEDVYENDVSREESNEMSKENQQIKPQTPTPESRSSRTPRST